MESLDPEIAHALNALLEDVRACIEILVELTNGATEVAERDSCTEMGTSAVLVSCALRERLTMAGVSVTRRVNGIVLHILDAEQYDDRLRAFARHQAGICERTQSVLPATEDRDTRKALRELYDANVRGALWCEQRATTFGESRLLLFNTNRPPTAPGDPGDPSDAQNAPASLRDTSAHADDARQPQDHLNNGVSDHE
jgi:hypothetical protein